MHDTRSSVLIEGWIFFYLKAGKSSVLTEDWQFSYLILCYKFQFLINVWLTSEAVWQLQLDFFFFFSMKPVLNFKYIHSLAGIWRYSFQWPTLIHYSPWGILWNHMCPWSWKLLKDRLVKSEVLQLIKNFLLSKARQ